eukprot:TRINITY_DN12371_c0_g1_i2.p1 TRINITY_DN12371_c0_g1~~TRINITY_DN12371_c0_g1_i2.p1  ORF type:complete len:532 (-),score=96.09 TRINITY_DN12371_c0_g1_i2:238-1833(-)
MSGAGTALRKRLTWALALLLMGLRTVDAQVSSTIPVSMLSSTTPTADLTVGSSTLPADVAASSPTSVAPVGQTSDQPTPSVSAAPSATTLTTTGPNIYDPRVLLNFSYFVAECEEKPRGANATFVSTAKTLDKLREDNMAIVLLISFCAWTLLRKPLAQLINLLMRVQNDGKHGAKIVQMVQVLLMNSFLFHSLYDVSSSALCILLMFVVLLLSLIEVTVAMTHLPGAGWKYTDDVDLEWYNKYYTENEYVPPPDFLEKPSDHNSDIYRYTWKPSNLYSDFNAPMGVVVLTFLTQIMLLFLVCLSFREKGFMVQGCEPRAAVLMGCTFFLQLHFDSQTGGRFEDETDMWRFLHAAYEANDSDDAEDQFPLYRKGDKRYTPKDAGSVDADAAPASHSKSTKKPRETGKLKPTDVFLRFLMSVVVNSVAYDFIIFLTPLILLSSKSAQDVVLNGFALSFIVTLDNTINPAKDPIYLDDDVRYWLEIPTTNWPFGPDVDEHGVDLVRHHLEELGAKFDDLDNDADENSALLDES